MIICDKVPFFPNWSEVFCPLLLVNIYEEGVHVVFYQILRELNERKLHLERGVCWDGWGAGKESLWNN